MDVETKHLLDSLQRIVEGGFADLHRKMNAGFKDLGDRITLLAEQQTSSAHLFDRRLTDFDRRLTDTNARLDDMSERLTTLVSAFMKSRTEDLQRSLRLRRLEQP